ncbi:MAG: uracil-DNA glycosylase [Gammaproteobacteria bacterium]|nr:uracil-DNA glycosylase [Gammaproteobacteria bacterium]
MPGSEHSQLGCQLSDELRHYYLDTMGIQIWQALEQPVEDTTADHREDKNRIWQQLEQTVSGCTKCDLHQSRSQTVFGVGNRNARLLIIGEAPGKDEDLQGEPFVGRAGQLLNAMLAAIGLQREQIYIANVLKCRPPNNRDPLPAEAQACAPWLQQQIALIQPELIFVLGRIAAHHLLNTDRSLASLRGRTHQYAGIPLIVSYHPAYLLRQPVEKRKSWQDLKYVKSFLDSGSS